MGSRMAANLLKNGIELCVYNRSAAAAHALAKQGAKAATSVVEAVAGADIVISMLSTPEVVDRIFLQDAATFSSMKENAIWIDCSTVNPSFSAKAMVAATKAGINFMDAPVAGTKPQAENATLVFFVGADKTLLDKVEPILLFMGHKILHIGEVTKGASFKMLVNLMLAQSMILFSETILLGEKMGIAKDFLLEVIPNLAVAAPFTKFKTAMLRTENYELQFPLEWMHKDLQLATTTAYELCQPLYLANLSKELFAAANKAGMGRLDFAAIHKFLSNR